jgi:hypothetical protein
VHAILWWDKKGKDDDTIGYPQVFV